MSIGSIPAFSAIVNGIVSNASAYFLIASCSLPSKLLAQSLSCEAANDSGAPPPATISGFSITSLLPLERHELNDQLHQLLFENHHVLAK